MLCALGARSPGSFHILLNRSQLALLALIRDMNFDKKYDSLQVVMIIVI